MPRLTARHKLSNRATWTWVGMWAVLFLAVLVLIPGEQSMWAFALLSAGSALATLPLARLLERRWSKG